MKRASLPLQRRDFVGLIGTTTFAIPFAAGAQQVPVIGFLSSRTEEQAKDPVRSQAAKKRDYVEGVPVMLEYRFADNHSEVDLASRRPVF